MRGGRISQVVNYAQCRFLAIAYLAEKPVTAVAQQPAYKPGSVIMVYVERFCLAAPYPAYRAASPLVSFHRLVFRMLQAVALPDVEASVTRRAIANQAVAASAMTPYAGIDGHRVGSSLMAAHPQKAG